MGGCHILGLDPLLGALALYLDELGFDVQPSLHTRRPYAVPYEFVLRRYGFTTFTVELVDGVWHLYCHREASGWLLPTAKRLVVDPSLPDAFDIVERAVRDIHE